MAPSPNVHVPLLSSLLFFFLLFFFDFFFFFFFHPLHSRAILLIQERGEGIESKCRQRPVEESLAIWKEMVAGSPVGLANCMRFKISVDNPNKAMRDPVAYRCNLIPHIRTGSKYKVYSVCFIYSM